MVRHGRYTIDRKLAEGGMAEIFLARQHGSQGFEKLVVLKRIKSTFIADEQFKNMLIDEAHISMSLQHNNIAQTLDLGEAGGRYFLVLELVDGWDLGRLLTRAEAVSVKLPTGLGLHIVTEVCRALAYAHSKTAANGQPLGIVHRDVSPQNVLVSAQGEVKLTDFGIAKALTKRDETVSGVVKGKVAFMSPEQALGHRIDARSDLYSVGILLYLVATGRRPFEGQTDLEVLLRVQNGEFPAIEQANPSVSPALAALVRRAMAPDLDQRYQTADELLVDIEGVLRSEHPSAGQTELKLWLTELERRDGVPAISKARAPLVAAAETAGQVDAVLADDTGDELLGNAVELSDAEAQAAGSSRSGSWETRPGRSRGRVASSPEAGRDATAMSDLSLPMPVDDAPTERLGTRRRSQGGFWVTALLVAGGGIGLLWWRNHGAPAPVVAPAPVPVAAPPVAATPQAPAPPRPTAPAPEPRPVAEPVAEKPTHTPTASAPAVAKVPAAREPQKWRRIVAPAADASAATPEPAVAAPAAPPTEPPAPSPTSTAPVEDKAPAPAEAVPPTTPPAASAPPAAPIPPPANDEPKPAP